MNLSRLNSFFNWSVRVGHLFGIPINLHITILMFLWPLLARSGWGFGHTVEIAVMIVLSILLHELGHALTAKHYRFQGLSIMLHGFGGFATSSGYRSPKQALAITLAGPAVTFLLGFVCLGIAMLGDGAGDSRGELATQFHLIRWLGITNLMLGALNLVPILPWDGGQALEAVLSFRISPFKAKRAVAHLGLILAPLMLIYGLIVNANFLFLFAIVGVITSVGTLLQTGGIRFGEVFADRRAKKELEAVAQRKRAQTDAYLDDVRTREKERDEKERLRRMLEVVEGDDL